MQATAAIALLLMSVSTQPAPAQATTAPVEQTQVGTGQAAATQATLPATPAPKLTEPLYLRDTTKDYTHLHGFLPNPLKLYSPTNVPLPRLGNTPRLDSLMRDGKIYLSLSDAVML